jgi:hypothetical protein
LRLGHGCDVDDDDPRSTARSTVESTSCVAVNVNAGVNVDVKRPNHRFHPSRSGTGSSGRWVVLPPGKARHNYFAALSPGAGGLTNMQVM